MWLILIFSYVSNCALFGTPVLEIWGRKKKVSRYFLTQQTFLYRMVSLILGISLFYFFPPSFNFRGMALHPSGWMLQWFFGLYYVAVLTPLTCEKQPRSLAAPTSFWL